MSVWYKRAAQRRSHCRVFPVVQHAWPRASSLSCSARHELIHWLRNKSKIQKKKEKNNSRPLFFFGFFFFFFPAELSPSSPSIKHYATQANIMNVQAELLYFSEIGRKLCARFSKTDLCRPECASVCLCATPSSPSSSRSLSSKLCCSSDFLMSSTTPSSPSSARPAAKSLTHTHAHT